MNSQENSTRQVAEIWEAGVRLYEAWFHLASSHDKDRFRASDQRVRSPNSVEIGLRIDLQARLECGELLAVGVEAGPTAHNGPVIIGRHFFSEDAIVDWGAASLTSHGISFVSIRVVRNPDWLDEPIEMGIMQSFTAASNHDEKISNIKSKGRPPSFVFLQPIVRELNDSGNLNNKSTKEIHNLIRDSAQSKFPNIFRSQNTPDPKTINKALNAEGLK